MVDSWGTGRPDYTNLTSGINFQVDISGDSIVISGQPVTISGNYVNITSGINLQVDISGDPVTISGDHVYVESGLYVVADIAESGIGVQIQSGADVIVASGMAVPIIPSVIKTDSVRIIPANSGGEVLHSGPTVAICVKACASNATDIYLGGAAPYRPYSGFGFCLGGGETKCYDINNFSALYLCAATSGDKICFDGVY